MNRTTKPIDIDNCARCKQNHTGLVFKRLHIPIPEYVDGNTTVIWSHWVECPTNGDPILMTIKDSKYEFIDGEWREKQ